jgi:transglutaminase/protease-like cytokinesis protein 3
MNINSKLFFRHISILLISILFSVFAKGQNITDKFYAVDNYVQSVGTLDTLNMGAIANIITRTFKEKKEKARAIFVWIANNIVYETKANKATDPKNNTSDAVLKNRRAGSLGYATLFQDMCSVANIRCLTADGFYKRTTQDINEKDAEMNHSWAVVQLGESPDDWYYVDAACGSGSLDNKGALFTKSLEDAYFFANKIIFNYQHYPNNSNWQLGKGPKSKKGFYTLPIIKNGAYSFNVTDFTPENGSIEVKAGKAVSFNFSASGSITKVSLLIQENKKQQVKIINNPVIAGGRVMFNYTFENEGSYTVSVLFNDKEVLQYSVEVQ